MDLFCPDGTKLSRILGRVGQFVESGVHGCMRMLAAWLGPRHVPPGNSCFEERTSLRPQHCHPHSVASRQSRVRNCCLSLLDTGPDKPSVVRSEGQTKAVAEGVASGAALARRLGDAAIHQRQLSSGR